LCFKKSKGKVVPESEDEMEGAKPAPSGSTDSAADVVVIIVLSQRLLHLLSLSVTNQMQIDDEDGVSHNIRFKKNAGGADRVCDNCPNLSHGTQRCPKATVLDSGAMNHVVRPCFSLSF
jgi:hypothetical protein